MRRICEGHSGQIKQPEMIFKGVKQGGPLEQNAIGSRGNKLHLRGMGFYLSKGS